ncbi:MAG: acetamidase/formamidase family protein [Gemmatimonadaceae bacterium]|nr:acetamidase/formamidase family protein [Gemmatimonadaceae bacterium]
MPHSRTHSRATAGTLLAAGLALTAPLGAQPRPTASIASGQYLVGIVSLGDTMWTSWTLRVAGDSVHGDMGPRATNALRGVMRRDSIDLVQFWDSTTIRARFRAQVRNGRLTGLALGRSRGSTSFADTARWVAIPEAKRAGPPRAVTFEPTVFHRTFSPAAAPALHIFPGDTVHTRTIDAGGVDWNGVQRWAGGNPQTGPFFVEGAMPGDVIAIHLHRVRLNRDFANAGTGIVDAAITTDLARSLSRVEQFSGRWTLDRTRGVARLSSPTPALANYEVPLRPQVGCLAVAPARGQAIRTQDSGVFGGNMDYNALREGTTVYLTANVPGALVFIGDGHAAQGDGELTGDALETSMDVSFSVALVRGTSIGGPRAESPDQLMAIGIAGDLQEALKLATSDLTRWLMSDYRLNAAEVASVLGTAMRYDVADMVGTQVSVVATIRRDALATLVAPR